MAFEPDTDVKDAGQDKRDDGLTGAEAIIADAKERFERQKDAFAQIQREGLDDVLFARLEEQWPEQIKRDRELDGRPCLTLNQLHAFIFQIVNDARQNKPGIVVHPVDSVADPETADVFNGLIRHIEQSSDADVAYDTAMDFAVSAGFGYFRINTRYVCDDTFEQDLAIERIANPFSVYPDPNSTAADSSDWDECTILDEIPAAAFEARWPGKVAISFGAEDYIRRDDTSEDMIQIAESWTREKVPRVITAISAADPMAALGNIEAAQTAGSLVGDQMIIGMEVYEANKDVFDLLGMKPVGKTREVTTYKVTQRILSGSDVLETVEWAGTYIPIVPVYGEDITVEGRRHLRSLIRGAKDAQRMFNYWNTVATELVALAPKTPFIGKIGTFDTDAAKWATANTQTHAYIEYDGSDAPVRQPFAGVPAGAMAMASGAQQNIQSIVGIFNSSIGKASNETSGVAIDKRDAQADTGSFHFHDNLNRAIRHAGRILLDLIPKVYSTARMLRILGPDGKAKVVPVNQPFQQPMMGHNGGPQMEQDPETGAMTDRVKTVTKTFDLTAGRYDLVVKAGPSFATQREDLATKLSEMMRSAPEIAPVVMDLFVKNYDIPDAEEIGARIEKLMAPKLEGESPEIAAGKKLIQQQGQAITLLKAQIASLKADKSIKQGELDVKVYGAQTDRLQALKPEGVDVDPLGIQALVMQSIRSVLANPEMLIEGQEGMDAPAAPQGLPPANNDTDDQPAAPAILAR